MLLTADLQPAALIRDGDNRSPLKAAPEMSDARTRAHAGDWAGWAEHESGW